MKSEYIPGQGYTVRDCRGRVLAKGLTKPQLDALMAQQHQTVINLARSKLP